MSPPSLAPLLISYDHARFHEVLDLRFRILRQPWQQPRGSERDEFDEASVLRVKNACVWDDQNHLVATGRLHEVARGLGQIRYMAVDESCRGHGFGRLILEALEAEARAWELASIVMNARCTALGFYLAAGYRDGGPGPTLYGSIEHHRMVKLFT